MKPQLLIVGNPRCRRVAFWKSAARRLDWPGPIIVPYAELLTDKIQLRDHLSANTLVRFEAAADDWDTFKLLLKYGRAAVVREDYEALDDAAIEYMHYDRGWLIKPRQAYLGFARLLRELGEELQLHGSQALHDPDDIAIFFDKVRCQERLREADIPIPESYGAARSYDEVRHWCQGDGRVMVKLAHGSGAAGCVALHWSRGRVHALTTAVDVVVDGEPRIYCSKRIRHMTDELEIAGLVARLCIEKVQVERWLPKAAWNGCNFDLRVVTIGGEPRHVVVRSSRSLFTNLTLGNARGDPAALQERMGPSAWQELRNTCVRIAQLFPRSFTLGIDVLVRPDLTRHAVLEINAFGDLLLNQVDRGEDTYTATLAAWLRQSQPRRVRGGT